jgi:hypothetical protein
MSNYYHFKNIRLLLTEGFIKEDLYQLCFDERALRPLYDDRTNSQRKDDLVQEIIDYAYKRLALDKVLTWAKNHNPARYENHQPYYESVAEDESVGATAVLPDTHLGRGIHLGGSYRDYELKIVAADWVEYGVASWVRSGWLFVPQWTTSLAITFFKIHIVENGQGYIHLVDAAEPPHFIWLKTDAGFHMEKGFHYAAHVADLWEFTWKDD